MPGLPHLDQRSHVGKVGVHGSSVGEVLIHPLHKLGETAESQSLCAGNRDSHCLVAQTLLHLHPHHHTPPSTHSRNIPPCSAHGVRDTQQGLASERQLMLQKVHADPRLSSQESETIKYKCDPATSCSTSLNTGPSHFKGLPPAQQIPPYTPTKVWGQRRRAPTHHHPG